MKKYIKPTMSVNTIEMEEMIATSGVSDVTGADGLGYGDNEEFGGGPVDGKDRNNWGGLLW